jgi:hypothetical protein
VTVDLIVVSVGSQVIIIKPHLVKKQPSDLYNKYSGRNSKQSLTSYCEIVKFPEVTPAEKESSSFATVCGRAPWELLTT